MAYRFKLAEPFEEGCRRIGREQIECAQGELKDSDNPVAAVHETRKSLKRLRALLRLVRPALGEMAFREQNARLRDIAQCLSSARDRHVLLETVVKLESGSEVARKGVGRTMRELINHMNGESPTVEASAVKHALRQLAEAKRWFARLELAGSGFEIVGPGLQASYHKGRRAFRKAYEEGTDESFHEWRKGAQQHWRHMALLSRAWPGCLNARVSEARSLSQVLGDDHDLALLVAFARAQPMKSLKPEQAAEIETLARERQKELRAFARPKGARLFAESAKGLRHRMAAYWESAVALNAFGSEEQEPETESKAKRRAPSRRRRHATGFETSRDRHISAIKVPRHQGQSRGKT